MKKLIIVLKNGDIKKYPWNGINFTVSDERVIVTENDQYGTFIFRAPASNVEYCAAIEEDEEYDEED